MKGMINIEFKKIEEGIIPIYEKESDRLPFAETVE